MATQEKTWNVANRLHSLKDSDNPEVNHIIAGADEIYDDAKGAKQSNINAQTDAALADRYTKAETYSKEQLDSLITTPDVNYVTVATFADLPQTGEANTIYRVSSYDGTQVDASKYALYAWNGVTYQLLAVRSAVGEVFDVSEYNSGATYETLTAALAAVPASVQRGGMSIKFILRTNTGTEEEPVYHDEYVQYRLMSTDWSNVITDWQGVDKVPTPGSHNFVESGGVQKELALGAVYDVSAKNPTAGPNNDGKFESLSALLSDANLNTLIPTAVRRGGMSIKFVHSSDNKYVQYRLMSDTFNTTVDNWQGVDDEPTAGSDNLVKSGGVERKIRTEIDNYNKVEGKVFYITDGDKNIIAKVDKDGVHSVDFRYGQEDTSLVGAVKNEVEAREEGDAAVKTLVEAEEARAKDAENTKLNHTIENDKFLITDSQGFIIAKVDNKGIHAPNLFEGKFDDNKLLIMDNDGYIIAKVDKNGVYSAKDKHAVACMVLSEAYYPTAAPTRDSDGNVTYAKVMFETGVAGSISITYTNGNSSSVAVVYGNYNYTISINRDEDGNVETVSVN